MTVIKRNGSEVPFDLDKVKLSLSKANNSVPESERIDDDTINFVCNRVLNKCKKYNRAISVEEIQDHVEDALIYLNKYDIAKHYIKYRYQRELDRKKNTTDARILSIVELQNEEAQKENANKNPTLLSTQRDYMAGEVSKDLTNRYLLPEDIREAHEAGIIHFHDSDYFVQHMHNCDLWNLEDMLQNGTVINDTLIEKPHSFATACNICTQIMAQLASNQYGGQTITLTHLAPFVDVSRKSIHKDVVNELSEMSNISNFEDLCNEITEKRVRQEIKKGVQTIQYQINTLLTANGQTPFVSIAMYLNEAKDEQTKADLAMIIEEVLIQRHQGIKNEKGQWITPAFPKLLYFLEEDNVREGTKYWYLTKLAAKCTAKRMVPDYISEKMMLANKIDKDGNGHAYPCMGCRAFLTPYVEKFVIKPNDTISGKTTTEIWNDLVDSGAVVFNHKIKDTGLQIPVTSISGAQRIANVDYLEDVLGDGVYIYASCPTYYSRFNQGAVTINLVDVACSSKKNMDKFWKIFDERLELCHRALRIRHERLKGTPSDVAPILWQHGALARLEKGEKIDKLLYGGYSTISLGYAGLWECVYYMTGKKLTEEDGKEFGLEVMKHMNFFTAKWRESEHIDYSLYGTPIESTTYKFAKCLQQRFGIIEGVTDKSYITNSYHVHVTEPIDAFTKLKLESEFQLLSPGGAISYVEVPNMENNIEAVLSVMQFIYDNIIYAELNTKSDTCQVCGYTGQIQIVKDSEGKLVWECPQCKNRDQNKMNVARRTCGLTK